MGMEYGKGFDDVLIAKGYSSIAAEIISECFRQNGKFGDQIGHSDGYWTAILVEEVGESARHVCEERPDKLREELVQVAAVAMQWINVIDRRKVE